MKTALLVDTGFSALPIFEALKAMNLEVHVVGGRPNDWLTGIADVYHCLDYSNVDEMRALIDATEFDYLIPGCTDKSYEVCSKIGAGQYIGIDGLATTTAINNKLEFKKLLVELDINHPKLLTSAKAFSPHVPLIVKPVDSFSGRGVSLIERPSDCLISEAVETARSYSVCGRHVIEEYVSGDLYSFSCFIAGDALAHGTFVKESGGRNAFAVDTSIVDLDLSAKIREAVAADALKLCRHLDIRSGLLHIQFIVGADTYWIIEATRRCPGDLYSILIELSTGFEYAAAYVQSFLYRRPNYIISERDRRYIIRYTLTGTGSKYLSYWSSSESLSIVRSYPIAQCGDEWTDDRVNRCALIFAEFDDPIAAMKFYPKIRDGNMLRAY